MTARVTRTSSANSEVIMCTNYIVSLRGAGNGLEAVELPGNFPTPLLAVAGHGHCAAMRAIMDALPMRDVEDAAVIRVLI